MANKSKNAFGAIRTGSYDGMLAEVVDLLESARRACVRSVNSIMTATYWQIGRRIVEYEQGGASRAGYGEELVERLAGDLTDRFGRGLGRENLRCMRRLYLAYPPNGIPQTVSGESGISRSESILQMAHEKGARPIPRTPSNEFTLADLAKRFPLPWSAYVRLLSVSDVQARAFYEAEALRGGWSVRQLDRQVNSQFYERTALSRNKAAVLKKGQRTIAQDAVTPEQALKDPFVLEFLGLKDEYSECELEDALVRHLEAFLLELGGDFAFVSRQRRLRIGDEWYRVDLVFFHRRLRCLVVIDLKLGKFTHADAGQMHMYLNYAREHWTHADENPPVGLILCAEKDDTLARYALDNLPNKVVAARYRMTLPDARMLAGEIAKTRDVLAARNASRPSPSGCAIKRKISPQRMTRKSGR